MDNQEESKLTKSLTTNFPYSIRILDKSFCLTDNEYKL